MNKLFTLILLCCFTQVLSAQFFIEGGMALQSLEIKRNESPGMSAVAELITLSGGNPNTTLPKRIKSRILAPKIAIGYRIPFEDFNLLISAGTSQDWSNSWKLRGSAALNGKTYPYPETFSVRVRAYQTMETGFSYGGEFCFDNQKSETLLSNSNMKAVVKGLLNQVSSDINLLGNGVTRNMQLNAMAGWIQTKDRFEFGVYGLAGLVGTALGIQLDFKIRYYLGDRENLKK